VKLVLGLVHNIFEDTTIAMDVSEAIFSEDSFDFTFFVDCVTTTLSYLTDPAQELIPQDDCYNPVVITQDLVAFLIHTSVLFAEEQSFQSRGYTQGPHSKMVLSPDLGNHDESGGDDDSSSEKLRRPIKTTPTTVSCEDSHQFSTDEFEEPDAAEDYTHRSGGGGSSGVSSKVHMTPSILRAPCIDTSLHADFCNHQIHTPSSQNRDEGLG